MDFIKSYEEIQNKIKTFIYQPANSKTIANINIIANDSIYQNCPYIKDHIEAITLDDGFGHVTVTVKSKSNYGDEFIKEVRINILSEDIRKIGTQYSTSKALEILFDLVDEKIINTEYETLDLALNKLYLNDLNNAFLIGILTATYEFKEKLKERSKIVKKIHEILENRIGPDSTKQSLAGLE